MTFSGFDKTDLVNYPSNIAATVFVRGCNFRCPYCHNVSLVDPKEYTEEKHSEEEIIDYLEKRKNFLDGVVVTGGEATLYSELPQFIKKVKKLGLQVKLDTNGTNPEMVEQLIKDKLIDYVAMDFKAPFKKYNMIAGGLIIDVEFLLRKTMTVLRNSNIPYEFRTTCPKNLLTVEDFDLMAAELISGETWYLQEFNPNITLDKSFSSADSYSKEELEALASKYEQAKVR